MTKRGLDSMLPATGLVMTDRGLPRVCSHSSKNPIIRTSLCVYSNDTDFGPFENFLSQRRKQLVFRDLHLHRLNLRSKRCEP